MKRKFILGSIALVAIFGIVGISYNNYAKGNNVKQVTTLEVDEKAIEEDIKSLSNENDNIETEEISTNSNSEKEEDTNVVNNSNGSVENTKVSSTSTSNSSTSDNKQNDTTSSSSSSTNTSNKNTTTSSSNSSTSTNNKNTTTSSSNSSTSTSSKDNAYTGGTDWDKVGEMFENSNWTQTGSGDIKGDAGTYEKFEGTYDGYIKYEDIYGK